MIEQVPAPAKLAVFPVTLHTPGVVDAKVTGKPDDAVALRATVPELSGVSLSGPNKISCEPMLKPHGTKAAPEIVVVLALLIKFGIAPASPTGAKLTIAVMGEEDGEIAPAGARTYTLTL